MWISGNISRVWPTLPITFWWLHWNLRSHLGCFLRSRWRLKLLYSLLAILWSWGALKDFILYPRSLFEFSKVMRLWIQPQVLLWCYEVCQNFGNHHKLTYLVMKLVMSALFDSECQVILWDTELNGSLHSH